MTLMVCTCRYRSDVFFRTYLLSTRYVRKHEQRNRIWKRILYVYSNQDQLIVYYFDWCRMILNNSYTDLFAVGSDRAPPSRTSLHFRPDPPKNNRFRSGSIIACFIHGNYRQYISRQNHQLYCNFLYINHTMTCGHLL